MKKKKPLTPKQKDALRRKRYAMFMASEEKRIAELILNAGDDLSEPIHSMDPDKEG